MSITSFIKLSDDDFIYFLNSNPISKQFKINTAPATHDNVDLEFR